MTATLTARETQDVARAAASGRRTVVLVHGLWLLASSWDPWRTLLEDAGYATVAPSWPGEAGTVAEARRAPDALAGTSVRDVTAHHVAVVDLLPAPPVVVGHSFGGLVAQQLAGSGLAAATVAIDPAPFRGVLPLPVSSLRSAAPVLTDVRNRHRTVSLTFEQFRYAWANGLGEDEARALHRDVHVPAPGRPLFQAATANLDPRTATRVDTTNPARGPLLVVSGERDRTVPHAIAHASYRRQRRNAGVTAFTEVPGRGHSLTVDSGWEEVARTVLAFALEHAPGALDGSPRAGRRTAG